MKENGVPFSMKNKEDPAFLELFLTLDTVKASVTSYEHEAMFWEKKLPGYDTLKLQLAVFWGVGLNFVLHGVEEQHNLQPKQFK